MFKFSGTALAGIARVGEERASVSSSDKSGSGRQDRSEDVVACSPDSIITPSIAGKHSTPGIVSESSTLFGKCKPTDKKFSKVDNHYDVVVIGAGFSGVFASQQVYKKLPTAKVALVDSYGLLSPESSSQNECFKMHTGLHYIKDRETAESCLRNTVEMAHKFFQHIQDKDKPNAPSRRGRHYLVNNVDSPSIEHVKAECENLKRLYAELLVDYPNAEKVFGSPEDFITYLAPEQYSHVASTIPFEKRSGEVENINVTLGIETPECQIDIAQFKQYFENVFTFLSDRVSLLGEHTVVRVSHAQDILGYAVETRRFDRVKNEAITEVLYAKAVINCTWQNIDGIDSDLNFQHNDYRPCTVRAKLLVKATVPSSLSSMNTCIFFSGPHVSLTRVPESATNPTERVLVTYEPKTNFGHFPSGTSHFRIQDQRLKKLIARPTSLTASEERDRELDILSREIMEGAAKYVPFLREAEIVGRGIGFVKVFAETDEGNEYLYDPYSSIHQRREDGIQHRDLCYVSFSGMKMSHSYKAAQKVVELVHQQLIIRDVLEGFTSEIMIHLSAIEPGEMDYRIRSALRYSLKAHLLSNLSKIPEILDALPTENLQSKLIEWKNSIFAETFDEYYAQLERHETMVCEAAALTT